MALDLNCRECQAGLAQVGQMAIGFRCFDHGNIGLEISELVKIVKAPLINQIAHLEARVKQLEQALVAAQGAVETSGESDYSPVPPKKTHKVLARYKFMGRGKPLKQ